MMRVHVAQKRTARYTRGEETIQDEDWGIYSNN